MGTVFIIGTALLVGAVLGYVLNLRTIFALRRRVRELRAGIDKRPTETMKRVVWACVVNGFAWVWCSYILAWLDKPQIAEELSKVALAEIIAPVIVYALKSAVENLSKNNRWPDRGGGQEDNTQEDQEPPEDGAAG